MSEKLRCPYCERRFDLDQVENAELWLERADLAARLSGAWRLANEYVDCFRASHGARMTIKRRARTLQWIAKLWESCEFEIDGKRYRTGHRRIQQALFKVCNMDKTGFRDHNYLKRVLLHDAERVSADGRTAKEEAESSKFKAEREEREELKTLRQWREKGTT